MSDAAITGTHMARPTAAHLSAACSMWCLLLAASWLQHPLCPQRPTQAADGALRPSCSWLPRCDTAQPHRCHAPQEGPARCMAPTGTLCQFWCHWCDSTALKVCLPCCMQEEAGSAATWWSRPAEQWSDDERLLAMGAVVVAELRLAVQQQLGYTCSAGGVGEWLDVGAACWRGPWRMLHGAMPGGTGVACTCTRCCPGMLWSNKRMHGQAQHCSTHMHYSCCHHQPYQKAAQCWCS